jgi:hypothetical protein
MNDFTPTDPINRCWVGIDTAAMQEEEIVGPMSYDAACNMIASHYGDDSVSTRLIDADDFIVTIAGSVGRGNLNAPYYSTLRELMTLTRNIAYQGAGAYEGEDDGVRDHLLHIGNQIEALLAPIR